MTKSKLRLVTWDPDKPAPEETAEIELGSDTGEMSIVPGPDGKRRIRLGPQASRALEKAMHTTRKKAPLRQAALQALKDLMPVGGWDGVPIATRDGDVQALCMKRGQGCPSHETIDDAMDLLKGITR